MLYGYLRALLTIALMCLAGTVLGVRLSAGEWLTSSASCSSAWSRSPCSASCSATWSAADAIAPAVGGIVTLFASWAALTGSCWRNRVLFEVIKALPSYWLVQAGKAALGGGSWPAQAWIVIAAWTAVLTLAPCWCTGATRAGPEQAISPLDARAGDQR